MFFKGHEREHILTALLIIFIYQYAIRITAAVSYGGRRFAPQHYFLPIAFTRTKTNTALIYIFNVYHMATVEAHFLLQSPNPSRAPFLTLLITKGRKKSGNEPKFPATLLTNQRKYLSVYSSNALLTVQRMEMFFQRLF